MLVIWQGTAPIDNVEPIGATMLLEEYQAALHQDVSAEVMLSTENTRLVSSSQLIICPN